ncbi:MAG: hypothetical protein NTX13_05100 [Acidobacteria bacterium]|jgi:hypothetical protein|nr:hypothetical protein [Acidobacteriota bacterium]
MRVLLDHSVPAPLGHHLPGHEVVEAVTIGWERLGNGDLLAAAESEGFAVLVTADKNLRYQQNLSGRRIAVVILGQGQWPAIRRYVGRIHDAVSRSVPGSFAEVEIPFPAPKGQHGRSA